MRRGRWDGRTSHVRGVCFIASPTTSTGGSGTGEGGACLLQQCLVGWMGFKWGRLYGAAAVTFKFHQAMHLSSMGLNGCLPTCWCAERKHKGPKRWANHITTISKDTSTHKANFDRSAFRDVSVGHLHVRQTRAVGGTWLGLEEPTWPASAECATILADVFGTGHTFVSASAARVSDYDTVHSNDVVVGFNGSDTFVGKVHNLFSVSGTGIHAGFYAILHTWDCLESTSTFSRWCTKNSQLSIVRGEHISCACIFAQTGSTVTVLHGGRNRIAK